MKRFGLVAIAILITGASLRMLWLTSDPPSHPTVGVVWHDEGPWVHNARNKALWGAWQTDNWNPMYLAPVFAVLEYGAFSTFGVGTWQARTVPVASGLLAILAIVVGLRTAAGPRAAVAGGLLLATNYTFVMWNRAALMESTMTAFIVIGWAAYAMSERRPMAGAYAGLAAVLAFFTKASAAFFVAALVFECATAFLAGTPKQRAAVKWTMAGLTAAGLVALAIFVWPHWTEFRFYNWQMSVERKPDYSLQAFVERASWLPFTHGVFTRMWLVVAAGAAGAIAIGARWRHARPAERLAVLWLVIGLVELIVHDSGNERRYVMFVPALIVLASMWLWRRDSEIQAEGRGPEAEGETTRTGEFEPSRLAHIAVIPVVAILAYVAIGSIVRWFFLSDVLAGSFKTSVRISAAGALLAAGFWALRRRLGPPSLASASFGEARALSWRSAFGIVIVVTTCTFDLWNYGTWSASRTDLNYRASIAVGQLLPAGTLVHGKLANGLALENQIRPVFIGTHFGNYDDRLVRDDVRYILTYVLPWEGYESPRGLMQEVLDRYPNRRIVAMFDLDETPGIDRAALIDKQPVKRNDPPNARD